MEKSKYEVFLKVVECGSFSAAAEELGYTASGMNRMMSALESELNISIFNRNKKGVHLSHEGELILPVVQKMVYWERQLRECTNEINGLKTGKIKIGTIYSIASIWLPKLVHEFKKRYPDITVSILQGSHQELDHWLQEGRVDLIFTTKRNSLKDKNWYTLKKDPLVAWVSSKHPLASHQSINWHYFETEPYIMSLSGEDSDAENFASENELNLNIQYSSRDNYTTYRMVEANLGISINNKMMSQNWNGKVTVLPLNPPAHVELGIRFPKHSTLTARKFFECVREFNFQENL